MQEDFRPKRREIFALCKKTGQIGCQRCLRSITRIKCRCVGNSCSISSLSFLFSVLSYLTQITQVYIPTYFPTYSPFFRFPCLQTRSLTCTSYNPILPDLPTPTSDAVYPLVKFCFLIQLLQVLIITQHHHKTASLQAINFEFLICLDCYRDMNVYRYQYMYMYLIRIIRLRSANPTRQHAHTHQDAAFGKKHTCKCCRLTQDQELPHNELLVI